MKFFSFATLAGLVAMVSAQTTPTNPDFFITNSDFDLTPGEDFTLEWTGNSGPVTVTLQTGESDNLEDVEVLASSVDGESFTWTVPEDLPTAQYNFRIQDDETEDVNWSVPFPLEGDDSNNTPSVTTSTSASTITSEASTTTSAESTTTSDDVSSFISSLTSEVSSFASSVSSEVSSSSESSASSTESEAASQTGSGDDAEESDTTVPDSKAGNLGSPFALIGFTVAAMLYFQ